MSKKINKVTIYYDDGTYEEIKTGVSDTQNQEDKTPTPWPDLRPDYYKIREYKEYSPVTTKPYWEPPFTITCGSTPSEGTYSFVTGSDYKYTITGISNGINVDLSK